MRMGQGVRTGLGHGGIPCVLQTQFSRVFFHFCFNLNLDKNYISTKIKAVKHLLAVFPLTVKQHQ